MPIERFKSFFNDTSVKAKLARQFSKPKTKAELAFGALEEIYKRYGFPEFKDLESEKEREELKAKAFEVLEKVHGTKKAAEFLETKVSEVGHTSHAHALDILISAIRKGHPELSHLAESLHNELLKDLRNGRIPEKEVAQTIKVLYEFKNLKEHRDVYYSMETMLSYLEILSKNHKVVSKESLVRQADLADKLASHHIKLCVKLEPDILHKVAEKMKFTGIMAPSVIDRLTVFIRRYNTLVTEYTKALDYYTKAEKLFTNLENRQGQENARLAKITTDEGLEKSTALLVKLKGILKQDRDAQGLNF